MSSDKSSTLVELLRWRAQHQTDQKGYTFLIDGEQEGAALTYGELDRHARAIGAFLQEYGARGERVLLLYPSGLEFIAAFFGCLYAGAVAVPAYPPRNKRHLPRIHTIVADAQAKFLLTIEKTQSRIQKWLDQTSSLTSLQMLMTDTLLKGAEENWRKPDIQSQDLAFLQYTSGSTASPKGVMVSHENLRHNSVLIQRYFEHTSESRGVIWLPPYHDMGLIGGILQPLFVGFPVVLMAPEVFLQRPVRWLQAISRYQATTSGGPNFAYDLCITKITPEQRETLDLSSWDLAFNGAEPIQPELLENFTTTFESCGFRREALYPCYGLAEATLFVTGGKKSAVPVIQNFHEPELENNQVIELPKGDETEQKVQKLVGCGQNLSDQTIVIVDPESLTRYPPNQIGEIWIAGPGVAQGYWSRPDETQESFRACLADTGEGPFLRTGDLGFIKDGELFITGRLKDLIIIRGRNHYPQDIEWTVEQSHPAIRRHSSAAFSVDLVGEERLVVVAEVERRYKQRRRQSWKKGYVREERRHLSDRRKFMVSLAGAPGFNPELPQPFDSDSAISCIRQAVVEHHELQTYAVSLLKFGTIPRTSSGKVQHHACKAGFLNGTLEVIDEWIESPAESKRHIGTDADKSNKQDIAEQSPSQTAPDKSSQTEETIQNWLVSRLSERVKVTPHDVDIREPFARYGLDSMAAVTLSGELQKWLGRQISPTVVYDYPTIEALAQYLAGGSALWGTAPMSSADQEIETKTIAIIGVGCRFPGAKNLEAFWQLLQNGVDAITEVPVNRWDVNAFYDPVPGTPGKMNTRWGGFLEDVDQFDSQFFGISPREAEKMDPQQRMLVEVTWEALENAGQASEQLAGSQTGVFIGISSYDYAQLQFVDLPGVNAYTGTGNALSIAANRLSYLLDLQGPSFAIDAACASSLVAVHQACQSLRWKECNLALVGGVNLILSPQLTIALSQAHLMAADGRCKAFDARADGYVRSEGCGIVILKRLSDALRDGDNILALIRGSAINQDGRSNGLTAPHGPSQQAVIHQALEDAGVTPGQLTYVEAHGTGTALGDPIEVNSLKEVLMSGRSSEQPCWIGSVKTNIGHLEAASGIASLIKIILALQHKEIPPHLHLKSLNPHISLEGTLLSIPTEREQWFVGKERRLAGVNSFGFGGTNAHVVLEEALAKAPMVADIERPIHLLTLSAKSEKALQELVQRYQTYLRSNSEGSLANTCFTANTGRSHVDYRLALVTESTIQLHQQLRALSDEQETTGLVKGQIRPGNSPKIAFLFTGQGSQYIGMGYELYETQPTFRQTLDHCSEILRPYLEKSLLEVLYPEEFNNSETQQLNNSTTQQLNNSETQQLNHQPNSVHPTCAFCHRICLS